jgi:hypothetical protein
MSGVSGPQLKQVIYARKPRDTQLFTPDERLQLQDYANKIGKIVANEPNFTLAFSTYGQVSWWGFCPLRRVPHVCLQLANSRLNPGDELFKENPDISRIKIPSCIGPLFQRLEPKNRTSNSETLFVTFSNLPTQIKKD